MPPPEDRAGQPRSGQGVLGLGFLFGAIYFIQGISEPTEGLITQPVNSLLVSWGHGPDEVASFGALLAIPWSLKPLYGLLTDFVPLFGSRRRSYLIATAAISALGLMTVSALPLASGMQRWLLAWLIVPTVAIAFSDVVADALMIETGQPRGLTGTLQSVQWGSLYAATLVTGVLGGYLSETGRERVAFLIAGGLSLVTLALALIAIPEPPAPRPRPPARAAARSLIEAARSPTLWAVAGFLALWNFNPFSTRVLYWHMTQELGLGQRLYGETVSLLAVGSIAASLTYGTVCRRVPWTWLVPASIALGIASTLAYLLMNDATSARLVSVAVGFTYMTATLIQLDLAARSCPPAAAGTTFALLMSLENLSVSLSTWLGGSWYTLWQTLWGGPAAFHTLVLVGAAFTAGCWLLVPLLRLGTVGQTVPESEPRPPTQSEQPS